MACHNNTSVQGQTQKHQCAWHAHPCCCCSWAGAGPHGRLRPRFTWETTRTRTLIGHVHTVAQNHMKGASASSPHKQQHISTHTGRRGRRPSLRPPMYMPCQGLAEQAHSLCKGKRQVNRPLPVCDVFATVSSAQRSLSRGRQATAAAAGMTGSVAMHSSHFGMNACYMRPQAR